ncbi:glycosyltransferase family 4 protein [Aeromonas enteropelogenes]|uniref:glycosyltransferase family 4 protein n=1 Tax=Aeromonas enteropelogenes TaxID=29489 RepID=UPI0038D188DA
MRLVFVANTAWSMFNFRHGLLTSLINIGYQLTVVSPHDDFSLKLKEMGCEIIDLPISSKSINPLKDLFLLKSLFFIYRNIKPDFIIHFTIKPNIYGSLAAKLAGIPSLAITTGLGYTFINDNMVAKIARQLYKIALKSPKEVWFLNEDDRQVFINHKLVDKNKTMLLHGEGINLSHFSPMPKSRNDEKIHFLLIARMLWDKGIGEYISAARAIKKKFPSVHFQLLGACDVPNPSAISRQQIAEWENEGVIEYLGTRGDVRPIIANADCVVLPSYREGIPRTMLEAAAMAKPLIVSDAPGCKDVVVDGKTGFLCKVKSPDSLAESFESIVKQSQSDRIVMGNAGRLFITERFDEKIIVGKYLDMLFRYHIHP